MHLHPLMLAIIASAGLGALIGLIRQWSEQSNTDKNSLGQFSGVRTFTFLSVLGCVAAFLSEEFSPAVLPVIIAAVAAHFVVPRFLTAAPATNAPAGSTTFATTLLTLCIGALVLWQRREEAALITAITVVLLGLKQPLHAWTRAFNATDMRATLQFIAITGVILPLVPNKAFGPFAGFNPYSTWMMVVLISGVGFAGYVSMRLLGARSGIFLTSLLGGIASSTATTLTFSKRSHDDPQHSDHYTMAVAIACTVMLPRLAILVALLDATLAQQLLLPCALMMLPGIAYVGWAWFVRRKQPRDSIQPAIENPLNLKSSLQFAALYAVVTFLVKAAEHFEHLDTGLLPLAFVSGLSSVDAIALSVASHVGQSTFAPSLGAQAIIVAAVANSVMKAGIAAFVGSPALRRRVIALMVLTSLAGLASLLLLGSDETVARLN